MLPPKLKKTRESSAPEQTPLNKTTQQESSTLRGQKYLQITGITVMTTPQKMDHQGSPARSKEASLLPSSPSALRLTEGGSSSSSENQTTPTKPLWAPLETDAPITLGMAEFAALFMYYTIGTQYNFSIHVVNLCLSSFICLILQTPKMKYMFASFVAAGTRHARVCPVMLGPICARLESLTVISRAALLSYFTR